MCCCAQRATPGFSIVIKMCNLLKHQTIIVEKKPLNAIQAPVSAIVH